MSNACYSALAVQTAVDLANTLKPVRGEDELETVEQLQVFLDTCAVDEFPDGTTTTGRAAAWTSPLSSTDVAEVRLLRGIVRQVLERAVTDPVGAAALVNDGLGEYRAVPVLRQGDGGWRTEFTSAVDSCAGRLGVAVFSALVGVISTLGPERLGVCAGPACRGTFVDLSRNGSKEYCTRTCAHRASVAAYRSRRTRG